MTNSIYFEYDVVLFQSFYNFTKGLKGDGYIQPDDDDKITHLKTMIVGHVRDSGKIKMFKKHIDATFIINDEVKKIRDESIYKEENNE
tara:strand:+ start:4992 stop:5255 length:264 start_codon:yes stop_codon:yes gene_type:complete